MPIQKLETNNVLKEWLDTINAMIDDNVIVKQNVDTKVDKVTGKGLSTEDFTTALKTKLEGVEDGANKYVLPTATDIKTGGVTLSDSTSSDSSELDGVAATPKAVKEAYDLASNALPKTGGVISGDLTVEGNINATITGNSETATKLVTPRTISLSGDVTGSASFDGSSDVELNVTVDGTKHTHTISNVEGLADALVGKASINSPSFTGTPYAPTANSTTSSRQIATTAFVHNVISEKIAASDAMIFKGTIGENATISSLPTTHSTGWTYKVITAGTYAGIECNVGDMIICLTDGETDNDSDWTVVEGNIDGAVTGPSTSVANNVAVFDGATGKVIKDSGFTIESSVPADAKFTDTTYTGSDGITLTGTNFSNSGVRGIASGSTNGTISVNTNGVESEVAVGGLKSAAFTESSEYTPASHTSVISNKDALGHVILSDDISNSDTSSGVAATPKAVKEAYDLASNALPKTGGVVTGDVTIEGELHATIRGNSDTSTEAGKLSVSRNITFNGDVTGSYYFDGSENVEVELTVVDDSHNHIIENIDGLQSFIDEKAPLNSPSFTGTPTAPTASLGTNNSQVATTAFVNTTVESAVDGVVRSPVNAVVGRIAVFADSNGDSIKDSGYTIAANVPADAKFTDTTYTGSDGITLTGTTFSNSGVRGITTGSTNGTISVNTNGTSNEVAVGGLKSAAFTESSAYLPVDGTAEKAVADASGNVISDTYATKTELEEKADVSEALLKTEQTLTDEEKEQVRQNLRFIGKNVSGQEFTIDGETVTASESAEIFGDYVNNIATGQWSIAEGSQTVATGRASHAEGAMTQALADGSHTEGYGTKATGYWSHAEGEMTVVSSYASHAEGSYCTMPDGSKRYTTASGYASHSEGGGTLTSGSCAHAEGLATVASGNQSHVEGRYTIAAGSAQHVEGVGNIEDTEDKYVHIAGNGTFEDRSNAHTLDWEGNAWFSGDVYVGSTSGKNKDEGSKKVATEDYVLALYKKLNTNTVLGFYCIEDVTIVTNGIPTVHPANSNVEVKFIEDDTWEIIPTSNNSILTLNAFPGALGTFYPWLEGVKQFSNILFDMNSEEMYTKWNQGNQGAYQVQFAQYSNCIFWSDLPYISEVSKRTNYTLYYSAQIPLCYSNNPDNTFKSFYLAFNVNSDPNWGNKAYRDSFAKATWATQAFSYYGGRTIGIFDHDNAAFNIPLPPDCCGLMYAATAVENAGVFDATNTTNFGAKSGSWRDAFGYCKSLRNLYIKNLKVNLNVSWSPLNYDSIYFILSEAANTKNITITLSPYTYNLLSQSDFELAASKNITIELLTTNYVEDRRLSAVTITGDGSKVLSDDGTYKTLPVKTSQLENDNSFVSSTELASIATTGNASDLNGTVAIAQGGTGATTAEFARKNLNVNFKTYNTYAQLGLSETPADIHALVKALPTESQFVKTFTSSYAQFGLPFSGTLIMFKGSYNSCMMWLTQESYNNDTCKMAFGYYYNDTKEVKWEPLVTGDKFISTYYDYNQLGLSEAPSSLEELLQAIPANSVFTRQLEESAETLGLPVAGVLTITKGTYKDKAFLTLVRTPHPNVVHQRCYHSVWYNGLTACEWREVAHLVDGVLPVESGGTGASTAAGALANLGITATAAELNYVDGVTSNVQTQLNAKAPLASPAFTGTPTAPTADAGTSTTQVATTAFVTTAIENKTSITGNAGTATKLATPRTISLSGGITGSASFDGSSDVSLNVTVDGTKHTHTISSVEGLSDALVGKASINSPSFTGTPYAPTADAGTNNRQIATTAFVSNAVSSKVDGPDTSADNSVVIFDGTTGKVVKDSGFTIGTSVPSNAEFTDSSVTQTSTIDNANYPVIMKYIANNIDSTEGVRYATNVTINPSTGNITASSFTGSLVGTAERATSDSIGNVIADTYATKTEVFEFNESLSSVATSGSYNDLTDKPTSLINPTSLIIQDSAGTSIVNYDGSKEQVLQIDASTVGLGNVTNESKATMFTSPAFTGTPTAPTPASTTNTTQIATTAFVQSLIDSKIAASDAMIYKGTIGTNGTVTALPTTHKTGWTYKVITAGVYAGVRCNVGDMIICLTDGTIDNNAHWSVIEGNIDGGVTGPSYAVANNVAIFDGATGKIIKDSGFSIASSVPADAKFTDTTYSQATTSNLGLVKLTDTLSSSGVSTGVAATPKLVDSALNNYYTKTQIDAFVNDLRVDDVTGSEHIMVLTSGYSANHVYELGNFTYPRGIDAVRVSLDGFILSKGVHYEEVQSSSTSIYSNQIKLLVDTEAEMVLHIWVAPIALQVSALEDKVIAAQGYAEIAQEVGDRLGDVGASVFPFKGSTTTTVGSEGLVPTPAAGNPERYLNCEGTWKELNTVVGATATTHGIAGIVPAPMKGEESLFLRGDGTWHEVVVEGVDNLLPKSGGEMTGNLITKGIFGAVVELSGTDINLSTASTFTKTIISDTTFTISGVPASTSAVFTLVLTNGGNHVVTYPTNMRWASGEVPTLTADGVDIITFITVDGGNTWYGSPSIINANPVVI